MLRKRVVNFSNNVSSGKHSVTSEFLIRPSWCDAELCLEQIRRNKATGHKLALKVRAWLQSGLFYFGWFVQKCHLLVLLVGLAIFIAWGFGLSKIVIETNIEKLWVPKGGRLEAERNFAKSVTAQRYAANHWAVIDDKTGITDDSATNYQVLIQTVKNRGENILTREQLMLHIKVLETVANMTIDKFNRSWSLYDICFKAQAPKSKGGLDDILSEVMKAVLPCVMLSPLDCFWEGSIPLGPFPPHNKAFGFTLNWQRLNPREVLKTMSSLLSSILEGDEFEGATDLFTRAGIGSAYQDRPCIDPLNPMCPKTAPNYVDQCQIVDKFAAWNKANGQPYQMPVPPPVTEAPPPVYDDYYDTLQQQGGTPSSSSSSGNNDTSNFSALENSTSFLISSRRIRRSKKTTPALSDQNSGSSKNGGLFGFLANPDGEQTSKANKSQECSYQPYVDTVLQILRQNETLARQFVPGIYENLGRPLTGGCKGFATKFMEWPEQLIVGDIVRDSDMKTIVGAGALQTVLMIANHNDVYQRYREELVEDMQNRNVTLDLSWWTPKAALDVLKTWQRNYSNTIFNWVNNTPESRILHPLAAASLEDMVEEFSNFNPMFIIIGYFLMIVYACFSALSFANKCVRSNSLLAFVGCGIVLLANVSGMGCTLILGIDFNATTTQILPFLLLSLGVDEMFLLLNKYKEIVIKLNHDEIGVLLRETGLSVLITYVNNILAFFAGALLPIPALKIFCVQVAIVLLFNLVAILTLFPAAMALDLKRQRAGLVDFLCCVRGEKVVARNEDVQLYTTHNNHSTTLHHPPGDVALNQVDYYNGAAAVAVAAPGHTNGAQSKWAAAQPPPGYDEAQKQGAPGDNAEGGLSRCTLTYFVRNIYAPLVENIVMKIIIVIVFGGVIIASVYGLFFVPIGLELSELVPAGTAPHSFLVTREKYFPFYPFYAIVKGDDPNFDPSRKAVQKMMRQFVEDQRKNVSFVVDMNVRNDWLNVMTDWLKYAQDKFDEDVAKGAFNESDDSTKPSRMGKIARKLICSVGDKTDCKNRVGKVRLIDSDGFINEDGFYNYLTAWYNVDHMTYYVTQANFQPLPPTFDFENDEHVPAAQHLLFSQIPFYVDNINNTVRILEMINAVRGVCEQYNAQGLPVFPLGIPFTFWELYLHLTKSLLIAFAIIIVAVFIAISIMLVNPWISALIVIVLMLMIVVELGFMGLIDIKLNPISAVTLITAVGIRVKFTVHVALSFLTTIGTRNERVTRTLEHMFVPVLHGGLSTLVGLIMLYFSKFEFIVMYYFMVMFALVILGILSGLILMPVILSWIGPPVEIKPIDGSSYLLPPDSKENGSTTMTASEKFGNYPTMEMNSVVAKQISNQPVTKRN